MGNIADAQRQCARVTGGALAVQPARVNWASRHERTVLTRNVSWIHGHELAPPRRLQTFFGS
jgi:hypothetical protein